MKAINKKQGSIVVFSLLILSIMLVLTQQLIKSVHVSSSFIRAMVDRERAEMVALGGVTIALELLQLQLKDDDRKKHDDSQLSEQQGQQEEPLVDKEGKEDTSTKKFLRRILPHLNRWMHFSLDEKLDGVEGEVKICISCENGKININEIYDFKKEEFNKTYEHMLKSLEIKGQLPTGELYNRLLEFFKKKKKPVEEISELYEIKGIDTLNIFYQPPSPAKDKKDKPQANKHLALQDIFTIWTDDYLLEPLMLSDALCALMGLRRPVANDAEACKDRFKQVVDSFKPIRGDNWEENWRFIQPLYDEKPKITRDLGALFSKQFGPTVYSVLSSGKVGDVEQQLLVIVKKMEKSDDDNHDKDSNAKEKTQDKSRLSDPEKKSGQQVKSRFKIVRAYWI